MKLVLFIYFQKNKTLIAKNVAAQRLYQKTCHILWLTWISYKGGGGHVRLVWMQREQQWQAASLPLLFSPPSISHTESSAKVSYIVNKLYPPSEPTLCLQALLGVAQLNICWSAIKMSIHLEQVKCHLCRRHPWPLRQLLRYKSLLFSFRPLWPTEMWTCLHQN